MTTSTRDLAYGRRGGRIVEWNPERLKPARACDVCGLPLAVGQKTRHFTCSPPAPCCGWPIDLIADMKTHLRDHQEP